MAWDAASQNLAVNVIARVESTGAYDAINLRDPITVGLMQWYGTRAAALLNKIRADNPSSWPTGGNLAQLTSDLGEHSDSSRWWTTRYLTGSEAKALKPVLRANHAAQHATISDDIDDYRDAAERIGMNPDINTQAVQFFCVMYHQSPARAIRIVNSAGPASSIDRLYAVCMNDGTFSQYRTRYTSARDMIKSGDAGDLIDLDNDDAPETDGDGGGENSTDDGLQQLQGSVRHLAVVGDTIHVVLRSGGAAVAVPDGKGRFLLKATEEGKGEPVPPRPPSPVDPDPDAPPSDAPSSVKRAAVVKWLTDRLGKYAYTNGPARTDPERTLATDCSGAVKAAYKAVTGITLGQITSSQYTQGRRVSTSKNVDFATLRPGDLIYFKWANPAWQSPKATDHVEMYMGNGQCVGHPGPGKGPRILGLAPQINNALRIWVQRHIED